MDPTSNAGLNPIPMGPPTRSHLLTHGLRNFLGKRNLLHPEKNFTAQEHNAEILAERAHIRAENMTHVGLGHGMPKSSEGPGEQFEPRQTSTTDDFTPHPERSVKLTPPRERLVNDIIALYSCQPTVERLRRYTSDCVYDDHFVYANDRYMMAGHWFALPKLFKSSVNEGYEVIRSDDEMIQFKNKQAWTFRFIPKTATITSLVSLVLDPSTRDSDFMQIKYHKDQTNEKDYSHEGLGFRFKKWQADNVVKFLNAPELKEFEGDKGV